MAELLQIDRYSLLTNQQKELFSLLLRARLCAPDVSEMPRFAWLRFLSSRKAAQWLGYQLWIGVFPGIVEAAYALWQWRYPDPWDCIDSESYKHCLSAIDEALIRAGRAK